MSIRRRLGLPLLLLVIAGGAVAAALLDLANPLRWVVVLTFLAVAPGLALVPLLRIGGWSAVTLAVGMSLSLDLIVSTAMVYAGAWSPNGTLLVLVFLTVVGAAAQVAVGGSGPSRASPEGLS